MTRFPGQFPDARLWLSLITATKTLTCTAGRVAAFSVTPKTSPACRTPRCCLTVATTSLSDARQGQAYSRRQRGFITFGQFVQYGPEECTVTGLKNSSENGLTVKSRGRMLLFSMRQRFFKTSLIPAFEGQLSKTHFRDIERKAPAMKLQRGKIAAIACLGAQTVRRSDMCALIFV